MPYHFISEVPEHSDTIVAIRYNRATSKCVMLAAREKSVTKFMFLLALERTCMHNGGFHGPLSTMQRYGISFDKVGIVLRPHPT